MLYSMPQTTYAGPAGGALTAEDDYLIVCCGCKRLRVGPLEFVEVPLGDLFENAESISHTLCPDCAFRHYGFSRDRYAQVVCHGSS